MIASLYRVFRHWSDKGSVYIISDTHFDDSDCKYMDENWITPDEHIALINKYVRKNDTFIHLGDVGNPEYIRKINGYKVLIMGNHDQSASRFSQYFDEIYTGPLMISDRILLSHEPIYNLDFCFNIHGHDHNNDNKGDKNHINLASNVCGYKPLNLGKWIKEGGMSKIPTIHRLTIDERIFCTDDICK